MAEAINTLFVFAFAVPVIYVSIRITVRLFEFWQRRAEVRVPALLIRDAVFFLCLVPFTLAILVGRIYDPLRQALRDNEVWQIATGLLIVLGFWVFAWYEHFVVGHRARPSSNPYEDAER